MSKIYYFNWYELKKSTNNDPTAILVLLYASIIGYNKKLCDSAYTLHHKLRINNIPTILFRKRKLEIKGRHGSIISRYKCEEPQSYIKNTSFLEANCSVVDKYRYLYMLGHREISNPNNYIPKNYVIEKYWKNPFIRIKENKLEFTLENNK